MIRIYTKNFDLLSVFFLRFDLDFWEWVEEINWYTYWNAMWVIMIILWTL